MSLSHVCFFWWNLNLRSRGNTIIHLKCREVEAKSRWKYSSKVQLPQKLTSVQYFNQTIFHTAWMKLRLPPLPPPHPDFPPYCIKNAWLLVRAPTMWMTIRGHLSGLPWRQIIKKKMCNNRKSYINKDCHGPFRLLSFPVIPSLPLPLHLIVSIYSTGDPVLEPIRKFYPHSADSHPAS